MSPPAPAQAPNPFGQNFWLEERDAQAAADPFAQAAAADQRQMSPFAPGTAAPPPRGAQPAGRPSSRSAPVPAPAAHETYDHGANGTNGSGANGSGQYTQHVQQRSGIPVDIEAVSVANDLLPVKLPRGTCSIPGENLLRLLGRQCTTADPWLPVGTMGPLIIMAHTRGDSRDFWGIPAFLVIRIIVDATQYDSILRDLQGRMAYKPVPPDNAVSRMTPPPEGGEPKAVLGWFINNYPLIGDEKEKLQKLLEENSKKPLQSLDDLKFLPRHYGAAILRIATGQQAYNPEEAPSQSVFPDALLEKHMVYPLYCGKNHVWLLAQTLSHYAFEDEWFSTGAEPVKFIYVMADPAAIRGAVARNRSRNSREAGSSVQASELS
jgi:hypothetical protein